MKILLVDDEQMMIDAIEFQLNKDSYEVVTSMDGYDAMKILEKESFDLVISDIAMPFLTGMELLNHIKANVSPKIPVILISALDNPEVILTAMDLGADDFITKPINMDELSLRVKKITSKKQN
ncbi:MAG: response regulator transcription factor [Bacteroidetes bacterium]|nr:response regulator transcription factor [Bacteroidota bacterium]